MRPRAIPKAPTRSSWRLVQVPRQGLRHTTRTTAAESTRNQATPAARTCAKSSTASAEPRYCEIAPSTNSDCGGRRAGSPPPPGRESDGGRRSAGAPSSVEALAAVVAISPLTVSPRARPLVAESREQVQAFHREALAAGGRDNGGPGPRPEYSPGYYGAFALD